MELKIKTKTKIKIKTKNKDKNRIFAIRLFDRRIRYVSRCVSLFLPLSQYAIDCRL